MNTTQVIRIALEIWCAFFTFSCGIATLISKKLRSRHNYYLAHLLLLDTLTLINNAVKAVISVPSTSAGYYILRVSHFLSYALVPVLILILTMYIYTEPLRKQAPINRRWIGYIHLLCSIHLAYILVSRFTHQLYYVDAQNNYYRSSGYVFVLALALIELISLVVMILAHPRSINKTDRIILISYLTIPMFSAIIQAVFYISNVNSIASAIALILLFLSNEVKKSNYLFENEEKLMASRIALKDKELELVQKDKELAEARLQISVSQLQPHFIFNTLGSIEQLCKMDPKKAAEATHFFSQYLRNNLHAINIVNLHSFSEELLHVHSYVWLETMRFGDDLCYSEDIQVQNFQIPILSVQPLVENAIKHGMMGTEEGTFHVDLKTLEDASSYYVEISDDGCGFNVAELPSDSSTHVGINNVRQRLQYICNGQLLIESTIGKGSRFTIVLPKKDQASLGK